MLTGFHRAFTMVLSSFRYQLTLSLTQLPFTAPICMAALPAASLWLREDPLLDSPVQGPRTTHGLLLELASGGAWAGSSTSWWRQILKVTNIDPGIEGRLASLASDSIAVVGRMLPSRCRWSFSLARQGASGAKTASLLNVFHWARLLPLPRRGLDLG